MKEAGVKWDCVLWRVSPKGRENYFERVGLEPWPGAVGQARRGREHQARLAVEVLVGPVSPASVLTRFLLPLQRTPKCQNLPQSPQPCLPGLSHPRAWRDCNQQDLSPGAWSGLRSRTALGRRPASTTPMRSPGSLLSPVVSPGQCEEEQRAESRWELPWWPRQGRQRGERWRRSLSFAV